MLGSLTDQLASHLGSIDQTLEEAMKNQTQSNQSVASNSSQTTAQKQPEEQKQPVEQAPPQQNQANSTTSSSENNVTDTLDSITELLKSSFGENSAPKKPQAPSAANPQQQQYTFNININ